MPANPNGVHVVCDEWVVHENHTVGTQWALLDWYQVQRTVRTCQPVSKLSIFQQNLLTAQGYVAELEPSTWEGSDAQWLNGYAGFWTRHFTFTVPLSTQVYKWVTASLMLGAHPFMGQHHIWGE